MTADRRAALVERVADLVRFNHDPIAIANEAISLIRAETLEEAARVVRRMPSPSSEWMAEELLRALKEKT